MLLAGARRAPLLALGLEDLLAAIVAVGADVVAQVHFAAHRLDAQRRRVEYDGLRTPLPRPLAPGESCSAAVRLRTPSQPGRYLLEIDLVEEGVSWFSAAGVPPLRVSVRVS